MLPDGFSMVNDKLKIITPLVMFRFFLFCYSTEFIGFP